MKTLLGLSLLGLVIGVTACSSHDDFQGRYVDTKSDISYEFQPAGIVQISDGEETVAATYRYDSGDKLIQLEADKPLPTETLNVVDENTLKSENSTLMRGVDYEMLADSTWIGEQGPYTFALTFTPTETGMETASELVSYDDEDMTYLSQPDDSITLLNGNKLLLDLTPYTVSEVSDDSFKISIGANSMVLSKHPKNTPINIKNGYQAAD